MGRWSLLTVVQLAGHDAPLPEGGEVVLVGDQLPHPLLVQPRHELAGHLRTAVLPVGELHVGPLVPLHLVIYRENTTGFTSGTTQCVCVWFGSLRNNTMCVCFGSRQEQHNVCVWFGSLRNNTMCVWFVKTNTEHNLQYPVNSQVIPVSLSRPNQLLVFVGRFGSKVVLSVKHVINGVNTNPF